MNVFIHPAFEADYQRSPLVLVDVGASGGADRRWMAAAGHLRVVGFDADSRAVMPSAGDNAGVPTTLLSTAVHREKARLDFHLTQHQEASSMFRANRAFVNRFPESDRFDVVRTVQMDADTLDSQLSGAGVADVDFVKVDTQGSELYVLEGATATLRRSVVGLEIEVEFAEVYEGQPLFADVDAFVRTQGFSLVDLRPYYWKRRAGQRVGGAKGQLVFGEALYLRDLSSLRSLVDGFSAAVDRRAKVLHAIAVCGVYGYLDWAIEMFEDHRALFSDAEAGAFREHMGQQVPLGERLPDFPGRQRLAAFLDRGHRMLRKNHRGWGSAGPSLGNR